MSWVAVVALLAALQVNAISKPPTFIVQVEDGLLDQVRLHVEMARSASLVSCRTAKRLSRLLIQPLYYPSLLFNISFVQRGSLVRGGKQTGP
jgi:hypothetical protein